MTRHAGTAFAIEGGRPFTGHVQVPGDKSISHRAVILGALADGVSVVRGRSEGDDVRHTEEAARCMGAHVDEERICGGEQVLRSPDAPLGLGNSATSMRLLAGVVAGRPWTVELRGDSSLSARAHGSRGRSAAVDGGARGRPHGALPATAGRAWRIAARHRLLAARHQRPSEVVRAFRGPAGGGSDGGARTGAHPPAHRGAPISLRGRGLGVLRGG